ncbi:MAG: flavin reductase family protein [Pelosinus sp.]|nr:flavin reductase family protein [Pelosinus sp.]
MKKSIPANVFAMPSPVWVVGTYRENDTPNIMTAAWAGICCSVPPCVAVSLQKIRSSYANILERKAFTINIPSSKQVAETDYVGIVSGKIADKFTTAHLTAAKSEIVDAPYIDEFPLILECRLLHTIEIGLHTQFIGEIVGIKADDDVLNEKGIPTLEKVLPFVYSSSDHAYYHIGEQLEQAYSIGMKFKI